MSSAKGPGPLWWPIGVLFSGCGMRCFRGIQLTCGLFPAPRNSAAVTPHPSVTSLRAHEKRKSIIFLSNLYSLARILLSLSMYSYCCLCILIVSLCILIVSLCILIIVYVFLLLVYLFLSLSMYSYCCLCILIVSLCILIVSLCILIVVYVFLLLVYSYRCLCILIVVYVFLLLSMYSYC